MRTEWKPKGELEHILSALYPINRLVCETSLATGLRLGDVLAIKPEQARKGRFTIHEQKTGKTRAVYLPADIQKRMLACAGNHYVFEGRLNGKSHRTRQAVFKDMKRVAKAFNVKENIAPHSLRKAYAVEEYAKCGNLKKVQKLLNHSGEAVTMLYAMADQVTKGKYFKKNMKNRK